MNLLKETEDFLKENNKSIKDIEFISCGYYDISIDNFIEIAKNTDYNNGFGSQEIDSDLKIVGSDWWLERHEYDGSEWWEYKQKPQRTNNLSKIETLNRW